MKKKLIAIILSFACLALTILPIALQSASAEGETQPSGKAIDVYLIGGQSNAVGCSEIDNNRTDVFGNIWYAGEIERYVKETKDSNGNVVVDENGNAVLETKAAQSWLSSFSDFKRFITGGYGYHATSIGPEYGMAKVFDEQYTGDTRALIFKTAYGGTYLHSISTGANWFPPSLWKQGYKPDTSKPISSQNMTGLLYQVFIENFEHVYNELVANGYAPKIKGMAWMQGEADAGDSTAKLMYSRNLKAFITDIRADIARITGDESMNQMPFVIGRIAKSFMQWDNPNTTMINNVQQGIADSMDNVYAIDTDDLIIVDKNGKSKGSGGWDICHYSFKDMVTLGERFAGAFNDHEKSQKTGGLGCVSSVVLTPMVFSLGLAALVAISKKKEKIH